MGNGNRPTPEFRRENAVLKHLSRIRKRSGDRFPGEWRYPKKSRGLLRDGGMWRVNATGPREPATGEVRLHRCREGQLPDQPDVPCPRRPPERLLRLAGPSGLPSSAAGHGLSGAYPHRLRALERHLRQLAHAPRSRRRRAPDRAASHGATDAREPVDRASEAALQANDGQRACLACRARSDGNAVARVHAPARPKAGPMRRRSGRRGFPETPPCIVKYR
jgi:hypothetical protein